MIHRNTERCHNCIPDEFIKHPAFFLDTIHHDSEIFVEQRNSSLRTEFLGQCRKTAYIGKKNRCGDTFATEDIVAAGKKLIRKSGVHIPRHG